MGADGRHLARMTVTAYLAFSTCWTEFCLQFWSAWKTRLSVGEYTRPFFGGSARSNRKVLHSHMASQGLNQSIFVGTLPLWYRNFWRSTLFQRGQLWNFTLAFVVIKLRDTVSIYSTVEVHIEQVEELKTSCQQFFNANCLLLNGVTSTVRTVGHEG